MAAFWGTGRAASSDGQLFPAAGRGEALNLVNARYGAEPGVKAYSHVSDRSPRSPPRPSRPPSRSALHPRRAPDERDRATRPRAVRHTGGFTDHVFAACSILGYSFVPRIRDLPSKRLCVFERAGVPKRLRPLVGGKVNVDLIDGLRTGFASCGERSTSNAAKPIPTSASKSSVLPSATRPRSGTGVSTARGATPRIATSSWAGGRMTDTTSGIPAPVCTPTPMTVRGARNPTRPR